ncbi:YggT family protein [Oceanotoga sp. DSM 15011]|jgi:YggT family protein|uniref:YggT family protein n=1 Tax=Oceanotoga teriensis TaxID=515440 RepID=A0AA45C8X3_9BACT|nr:MULTISPECIES: YggT family protein [Oceanotoga]MDN5343232.1 YggT family protein [Oceanotoga sp.]MDO7975394.1 YggT family protein [Oceanotoga teriensis]PWJ96318.1 YggT family protein [Oceanotoga teriensis]UYP00102.1 YggT family protein [Oceanotoga sp. DSM 15011]
MFALGNFFTAIGTVLRISINFIELTIIISVVMSFLFPVYNKFKSIVDSISEFFLRPIRRYLPVNIGMFDFSPFIAILILIFTDRFLVQTLIDFGNRLG